MGPEPIRAGHEKAEGRANLAHSRLTPDTAVGPAFEPHLVVALFPDEQRPRDDERGPFELVQPPHDWLEPALTDGLEDNVGITGVADVQAGVGGALHVLGGSVEHDEYGERMVAFRGEEDRMCTPSSTAKEEVYIRYID